MNHSPAGDRPRSGRSLVAGGAAAALIAVSAWVLVTGGDVWLDVRVHEWLVRNPNDVVHFLATWAKQPGTRIVYLVTVGAAAAAGLIGRRSLRPVALAAALVAVETLALFLFKVGVGRRAPRSGLIALHTAGTSFPAGHAANAVLGAGLVGWWATLALASRSHPEARPEADIHAATRRRATRAAAVLAIVVGGVTGTAMTWLDYHWVTDTLAGWAAGTLALLAGLALDDRFGHPSPQRQMASPNRSSPDRSKMSDSK